MLESLGFMNYYRTAVHMVYRVVFEPGGVAALSAQTIETFQRNLEKVGYEVKSKLEAAVSGETTEAEFLLSSQDTFGLEVRINNNCPKELYLQLGGSKDSADIEGRVLIQAMHLENGYPKPSKSKWLLFNPLYWLAWEFYECNFATAKFSTTPEDLMRLCRDVVSCYPKV